MGLISKKKKIVGNNEPWYRYFAGAIALGQLQFQLRANRMFCLFEAELISYL